MMPESVGKLCYTPIRSGCVFSRCGLPENHKGDHAEVLVLSNGKRVVRPAREQTPQEQDWLSDRPIKEG